MSEGEGLAPRAPLPCGFSRDGLPLRAIAEHYLRCEHPDCRARAEAQAGALERYRLLDEKSEAPAES